MRAVLVALCLTLSSYGGSMQLKDLALRPSDLPKGFVQRQSRPVSNQDLAKMTHAAVSVYSRQLGRVGGYETFYLRDPLGSDVWDVVSEFRSATGASRFEAMNVVSTRGDTSYGSHFRPLEGVRVGDGSYAWTVPFTFRGHRFTAWRIYFHRGPLDFGMNVEALAGTFTTSQVVELARKVDERFKSAEKQGLSGGQ